MTVKGTQGNNFKPIGLFKNCTDRGQQVSIGIQEAQRLYTYEGYDVYPPNNPDKGGDDDFIAAKYPVSKFVSCKTTTQYTRSKNPKPELNIRTNSTGKNNYGDVKIPTKYDELICIAENGQFCRWTREQLKDVKSTVAFGCKGGEVGKL
tara:strand:- start:1227 stop:1673 length:447 start_codon:yes stop_codon:yes gene_type:complete